MGLLARAKTNIKPVQPMPRLSSGLTGTTSQSTLTTIPKELGTIGLTKKALNFGKDIFTGGDQTTGGIVRNTVLGLPKALYTVGKGLLSGLKEQVTNPDVEQQKYEAQMLPEATTPVVKTLTQPGVTAARIASRIINPGLRPFAENLAQLRAINEKGGILDMVNQGKIPASTLDEFAVLHKTAPQIVGDVAQAVLMAYAGGEVPGLAGQAKNLGVIPAIKKGAVQGLKIGEAFGVGQALSSGTKSPLEFAGTVGTSGAIGSLLGAVTSGAIPVSKEVLGKVKEAKAVYDAMTPAEKQAGKIKNPLEENVPPEKPGELQNFKEQNKSLTETEKSRFKTGEELVAEISRPKNGQQGLQLNKIELNQLINHLLDNNSPNASVNRGIIYKPYGYANNRVADVILGKVDVPNFGESTIVAEVLPNGKLNGRIRIHGTPLDKKTIIGNLGDEGLLALGEGKSTPSQKVEVPVPLEKPATVAKSTKPSTPKRVVQTEPTLKPEALVPKPIEAKVSLPERIPQTFDADKYVAEQVKKLDEAQKVGKPTLVGKISNFLKETKTKLVDFTAPIEDTLDKAVLEHNIKLLPEDNIHNQIDRVLRAPTLAGQFAKDKGIVDVIRKVDKLENLDQYLIAKHAIELDTRGITTGRNIAQDTALVKTFKEKYEPYAKQVAQYSQDLLDYSVKSGLVSKEVADMLRKRYPDYVPFSRVFNELEKTNVYSGGGGVASLSRQTLIRKIEGSERQIESPIQSLLAKTNDAFKQGEKNIAGKLLVSYKDLPGNPFQLKDITGEEIKGKSTITFFEDGEKKVFETTPDIARAAKSLNVQQLNILGKIFAFPVRLARLGITGLNLPFIGANIAKDAVSAFINSTHGLKTSMANPVNFVRSLFSAVAHDELYQEMVRAGGAGTTFDIARNQAGTTVSSIRAGRNLPSKILYNVTHPGELLRAVEDIVGRGEEFTRIQQYRGVKEAELKAGATPESATVAAARQARDATVNFARRGEWGTVLNSVFLYINAGIQGSRTLLRSLKNKPAETVVKIAVSALFPMAATTAWNLKDPKRREAYNDIAEYEKQNNLIIIPPNPTKDASGKWNVIKVPLSQEINNLVSTTRRAIEMAYGGDPLKFIDFADAVIGTVSPVTPRKGDILSFITPQAIKPPVEAAANIKLFTGSPQVPQSLQKLSPENQVRSYTSGTAREIGGLLNVSPIKVEEFIKGTFGGVGSQALNVIDRVQKALGKKDIVVGGQDIMDAIAARFNKAQGGVADDKTIKEIQDLLMKQADVSNATKIKAEALDLELAKLPSAEARLKFDQLFKDDPKLASAVATAAENRKLGLTYEEKIMKQLGVENGERAKYIDEQIMKLPVDQRAAYYTDLVNKKVISANVAAQIQSLRKKETVQ